MVVLKKSYTWVVVINMVFHLAFQQVVSIIKKTTKAIIKILGIIDEIRCKTRKRIDGRALVCSD